jgi:pyruvate/2-oxoglutarate dehydrogenase complex dihydrolipoamide dehydrogenase (E3) component
MIGHDAERTYKAAIIGAGSGGLTMAIGLAGFGHDVVMIEGDKIGGDCTNVGCIPSKALLHAARVGEPDALAWARSRRDELAATEDNEMEEHEQIHLVRGWARLTTQTGPHVVAVDGPDGHVEVRADNVVICGGSKPIEIPIEGLPADRTLTNENLFELAELPTSIVLVGGGVISLEMATAFTDMGVRVEIVELQDRLIGNEDPMVSATMLAALSDRGVHVHTGTSIERFDEETTTAHLTNGTTIEAVDKVFIGVGRRPRLGALGLDDANVDTTRRGIVADDWGRTSVDGVYAVGDITGNTLTTHGANAIGRRAVRAIALPKLPKTGEPRAMANAVYSRPEIASVGLAVDDVNALAKSGRRRYEVQLKDIDRGFTDDVQHGFVAVDVERFSGKVLRAVIVGPSAAEIIGMFTLMIDHSIGLRKVFGMVHPYPAYAQAVGHLADEFARDTYPSMPKEWWAMMRSRFTNKFKR